jgi:hypothetical protein
LNFALVKAGAALLLLPLSIDPVRRRASQWLARRHSWWLIGGFALSRVGASVAAFGIAGMNYPADLRRYYEPFATDAITTGRSSLSPYSPGFDYLMGALLWVFRSPLSLVLGMVAAEITAFGLVVTALRKIDEPLAIALAWLWMASPISLLNVALGGQDEALVLLAWAAVFAAVVVGRASLAGAAAAVGIAFTKVLAIAALIPIVALPSRKLAIAMSAFATTLGVAVAAAIFLRMPLATFGAEADRVTSGNVWMWAAFARGTLASPAIWRLGVAALGVLALLAWLRRDHQLPVAHHALRLAGTSGCAFLMLSPKSLTAYSLMFLPAMLFLMLLMSAPLRLVMLAAFVTVAVTEPSIWYYFNEGRAFGAIGSARAVMFGLDSVLLGGYGLLIWTGLRARGVPALANS